MSGEDPKVAPEEDVEVVVAAEETSDERLGSDQRHEDDEQGLSDEDREARRAARREKRKQQKAKRRQYAEEEQLLIRTLSESNARMMQQLEALTGRVHQSEGEKIEGAYNHWLRRRAQAQQAKARAIELGDGKGVIDADNEIEKATAYARHFGRLREETESAARAEPEPASGMDPATADNVRTFADRFPWYDVQGRDRNSQVVLGIDAELAKEGYDPRRKDYWEELEARMAEVLPAELMGEDDDYNRDERGRFAPQRETQEPPRRQEAAAPPPRREQRRGPPTAGASEGRDLGSGIKKTVTIPKALEMAMRESGAWDVPERRKRVINDYLSKQREREREQR